MANRDRGTRSDGAAPRDYSLDRLARGRLSLAVISPAKGLGHPQKTSTQESPLPGQARPRGNFLVAQDCRFATVPEFRTALRPR
jgi:hypothetical protein